MITYKSPKNYKVVGKNNEPIISAHKTSWLDVLKLELEARQINYEEFKNSYQLLKKFIDDKDVSHKNSSFKYLNEKLDIDEEFWQRMYEKEIVEEAAERL